MGAGLISAFSNLLGFWPLITLFTGTALGMLVGALPGLSSPMALIVLIPITYNMDTIPAFQLMIGIYLGTKLGGSYSAILLRTPGTPAAACTVLDGFPMAEQGKPGEAIGYAIAASTIGGIIGWVAAVCFVPTIAAIALHSEPADIALIAIAGLCMVSALIRGSLVRGFLSVLLGLMMASVGFDVQDGVARYTFSSDLVASGIPYAAVVVGFFGVAVILSDLDRVDKKSQLIVARVVAKLPQIGELLTRWKAWTIGIVYGILFGAVPGVGADGSTFLAYATVRDRSKSKARFGTGIPEGIITPESCNNASTGGAIIPMLTLGIPGDGSTTVMLSAMILHGLEPGVLLMRTNGDLVFAILAAMGAATIMMLFIGWAASGAFISILRRDRSLLFPFVMVFASIGAFAGDNDSNAIYIALVCGIAGYLLERAGFSIVALVLGFILGPIIEYNLRLGLAYSSGDWIVFVDTWPRIIIVSLIASLILNEVRTSMRRGKPQN